MNLPSQDMSATLIVNKCVDGQLTIQPSVKQLAKLLALSDVKVDYATSFPEQSSTNMRHFYFVDSSKLDPQGLHTDNILANAAHFPVVLFNSKANAFCEKTALMAGIKGFFYLEDRADIVVKGIEHIMNGGLWFKREIMNSALIEFLKCSSRTNTVKKESINTEQKLTKREKMIVDLIASGAQNREIADQLYISPNTVKTHLYSVFRKTNSRNRVELLAWSQRYFA